MAGTVVDLHTHLLPKSWPNLAEKFGYEGWVSIDHCSNCCANMIVDGKVFREIDDRSWDPERRLRDCDLCGVDVQVLSTVPIMFGYWAPPRDTKMPRMAHTAVDLGMAHMAVACGCDGRALLGDFLLLNVEKNMRPSVKKDAMLRGQ